MERFGSNQHFILNFYSNLSYPKLLLPVFLVLKMYVKKYFSHNNAIFFKIRWIYFGIRKSQQLIRDFGMD